MDNKTIKTINLYSIKSIIQIRELISNGVKIKKNLK